MPSLSIMPQTAIVEPIVEDEVQDALLSDGLAEVDEHGILHLADVTEDDKKADTEGENPAASEVDSAQQ